MKAHQLSRMKLLAEEDMQNKHLFSLEHITTHRVPTLGNTPPVNGNSSKGIELDAIQSMECSKHIHLCSRKTVQLAEL